MTGIWGSLRAALFLVCAMVLGSCALVDKFSGRAVDYNLEAEQAQEEQLLLNIIRASLRRPMQFTTLQSVTGNASATGTAQLTVPFGESGHRPNKVLSPDQLLLSGGLQGGPQFTVPILDTQEFYQGILTPIPLQAIDYYIKQGFPPQILFMLFVGRITLTADDGSEVTFVNNVSDDLQYRQFSLVLEFLLGSGLTTEHIDTSSTFGPPLQQVHMAPRDSTEMSRLLDAYSKVATAGLDFRASAKDDRLTVVKKSGSYRFCFARKGDAKKQKDWLGDPDPALYCGNYRERKSEFVGAPNEAGISQFRIALPPRVLEVLNDAQTKVEALNPGADFVETAIDPSLFAKKAVAMKMTTRSTEGILYYLGEVVRRHLVATPWPASTFQPRRRIIQIQSNLPFGTVGGSDCDDVSNQGRTEAKQDLIYFMDTAAPAEQHKHTYFCEPLFFVAKGGALGDPPILSVEYGGVQYTVATDPLQGGRSMQVLEVVKQLWALNTSGKQFPTTNVFSIITPP